MGADNALKRTLALIAAALSTAALGQQFVPYSYPKVTETQWLQYFEEVKAKHAATMRLPRDQHLAMLEDAATKTSWVFTQPGHAAHPAWTTSRLTQSGGITDIERNAFFVGDGRAFGTWYLTFLRLDDRKRQLARERREGK